MRLRTVKLAVQKSHQSKNYHQLTNIPARIQLFGPHYERLKEFLPKDRLESYTKTATNILNWEDYNCIFCFKKRKFDKGNTEELLHMIKALSLVCSDCLASAKVPCFTCENSDSFWELANLKTTTKCPSCEKSGACLETITSLLQM